MKIPHDFWDKVETENLSHIIISDTDSLFVSIPDIICETTQEYVDKANELANNINTEIINYLNNNVLPKMNLEKNHNETFFKTESIMSSIMCLDVKKKYCLKEIAKEGKIHGNPITKYTGISVVRSNSANWTKDFIRETVSNLALNTSVKSKIDVKNKLQEIAEKFYNRLKKDIELYDFSYIGVPCKWGSTAYKRDTAEIIGMKLYNTLKEEDYFQENTNGKKIPIKIKNINEFLQKIEPLKNKFPGQTIGNITVDKLNFLVVPVYHQKEILEPIFNNFGIEIDLELTWKKLVETTLLRIIDCIKESHGLPKT
ncbi:MAG: hypothetical protein H7836_08075 [Magnetococcus sp. YQC-3]